MAYTVLIQPNNEEIVVEEGETILQADMRQSGLIAYGCCSAICGTCRAKVLQGEISYAVELSIYGITEDERGDGFVLCCSARPTTDLVMTLMP